jgi:hypothetical protein
MLLGYPVGAQGRCDFGPLGKLPSPALAASACSVYSPHPTNGGPPNDLAISQHGQQPACPCAEFDGWLRVTISDVPQDKHAKDALYLILWKCHICTHCSTN